MSLGNQHSTHVPDEIPITKREAEQIYRECAAEPRRRLAAQREAEQLDRERWSAEARGQPGWRPLPMAEFRRRLMEIEARRRPVEHGRAPRRRARRAPRRAARGTTTSAAKSGGDSGDGGSDPPGDGEPPLARLAVAHVGVAPVMVTDAPRFRGVLAAALALTPRQLRELVEKHQIRHSRRHAGARHIIVRVDDLLAALGLGGEPAVAPSSSAELSEDDVVALAARPRGAAS